MVRLSDYLKSIIYVAVVPVVFLTSCFTGVESTPKITAKHVDKEGATVSLVPRKLFCKMLRAIQSACGVREKNFMLRTVASV